MARRRTPTHHSRAELISHLPDIEEQVVHLRLDRFVFRSVMEIVRENEDLRDQQSEFFGWMVRVHATSMLMAVRRLTDESSGSVSLMKLMKRIKEFPHIISRAHYESHFKTDHSPLVRLLDYPRREYLRLLQADLTADAAPREIKLSMVAPLGQVPAAPSRTLIESHADYLRVTAGKIREYCDKRVAHHDLIAPSQVPTFSDLDEAIEAISRMLKWYILMLTGVNFDLDAKIQYDWTSIFRIPWAPDPKWTFDPDRYAAIEGQVLNDGATRNARRALTVQSGLVYLAILAMVDDPTQDPTTNWNDTHLARIVKERASTLRETLAKRNGSGG